MSLCRITCKDEILLKFLVFDLANCFSVTSSMKSVNTNPGESKSARTPVSSLARRFSMSFTASWASKDSTKYSLTR